MTIDTAEPRWYSDIPFSAPLPVALVRLRRELLPNSKGIYVFATTKGRWEAATGRWHHLPGSTGGNLYVGITTKQTIRKRLAPYLRKKPEAVSTRRSIFRHAGLAQLFVQFAQWYAATGGPEPTYEADDTRFWLRWAVLDDPARVEGALIDYLKPAFNSRHEQIRLAPKDHL